MDIPMSGERLDRIARPDDGAEARLLRVEAELVPVRDGRLVFEAAASGQADAVLLGVDDDGRAVLAADGRSPGAEYLHLRDVAAELPAEQAGLAAHAVALLNWHRAHRHCPRCGAPTEMVEAGHMRRCSADGSLHHPRTDPCVIVLVHHGDEVLLGRRPSFPPGRFSVLAGFVEPGETLEAAVAREVEEESGVRVRPGSVEYVASQPWPFPASLMLGFTAAAATTAIAPHDGELEEVRWMSRDEVLHRVAQGDLLLPPPASIARHLLDGWLLRGDPGPHNRGQ